MINVATYNAKDCTVIVGGVYITGLGEDMVSFEKDEELFSTSVGAQGDVVVNETNNELGTVTLSVQATSPQKSYLLNLARSRKEFAVWVTNKTLRERFGGTRAMVKNYPELTNGAEAEDREFEIQVFDSSIEGL